VNPIHAGPRLTLTRVLSCVLLLGAFIWLSGTRLLGWWGLAVFVAGEIAVYRAFTVLVGLRSRTLALLRCFGASRSQVFGGVLIEAATVGLLASFAGLAVVVFGHGGGGVAMVIYACAVGIGGAMAAAAVPAFRASRVSPSGASRPRR
jgi:ABC-type antimicrobial peptide transport system permease subunit